MSRGVNDMSSMGGPGIDGRPKTIDAPSIKSSSNSSGKSTKSKPAKEKRPRRNHSPPAMFSHSTLVKPKPTTPSKAKSVAPSVRSGDSGETFNSATTARARDPPSMYQPPPLPSKSRSKPELRGISKSTLDLRTPTRDTFSLMSGSSGSGSGGAMSIGSGTRSETSTGFFGPPTTASSITTHEETRPRPRQPSLPSPGESLPPTSSMRDRAGDQAPARVRSVRSASRVQTPTTRDGNTSDFSAQSHRLADLPMPPQKVLPAANAAAEYVLGVIGSKACGKSTFIKHAIAGVDAEESRTVAASADGPTMTLACTSISRGAVRILEIDADELLDLSEVESEKWRLWPDGFPKLGGVAVCYDATRQRSYAQAKQVLAGLNTSFPEPSFVAVLVACKSDSLENPSFSPNEVSAERASKLGSQYGIRFAQVSARTAEGISHMVHTFQWMLDHLANYRSTKRIIIIPRPKKTSAAAAPTGDRPLKSALARTRSAGDLVSTWMSDSSDAGARPFTPVPAPAPAIMQPQPEPAAEVMSSGRHSTGEESLLSFGFPKVPTTVPTPTRSDEAMVPVRLPTPKLSEEIREARAPPLQLKIDGTPSEAPPRKPPAPLCMRWATTEQLIDKLLFAGVSDDEPWFIFNFFLTYRLFMTPRTVLLSFQKRLRDLDDFPADPIFAGFVQQKLCELLLMWIEDYPNDFASPGAPSALAAVVRTACDNVHLMYYGSEFTYFLDELATLTDDASSWAFVSADTPIEEDESAYDFDLDFNHDFSIGGGQELFASGGQALLGKNTDSLLVRETDAQGLFDPAYNIAASANGVPASAEDRFELDKSPPPTGEFGRRLTRGESLNDDTVVRGMSPDARRGGSPALRALAGVAMQLLEYDPLAIAEEITRIEANLFLKIKPRDWVRRGVKDDKLGKPKSIIEMNAFFDRIGKWVMSVVVSLNRASERAQVVTHLCTVAQSLRVLNNYSSLRAFHVGINCVCEIGDVVQSQIQSTVWRKYQSADKLLRVNENHLLYRMAVKNTFGAGIPSLEVHSSDLSRIGEMPNTNTEGQIHWGKFTHLGNNIHEIHAFQERIREDGGYAFEPNPPLAKLIMEPELVDMDIIYERCSQLDKDLQNGYPVPMQTSTASKLHKYLRR